MSSDSKVIFKSAQKNPENPAIEDIDPKELLEKLKSVVVVDVRRPDEWEGELGHIPGALHMVLDNLPQRISELPQDKTLVFVCKSGGRSGRATAFAQAQGFKNIYNMKGGMLLWNQLSQPTEGRSDS